MELFLNLPTVKLQVDMSIEGSENDDKIKVEKIMIKFLEKMEMIN